MIDIPKNEIDHIKTYAEEFLACCAQDMEAKDILCQAYQELMDTSSAFEGEIAAESILSQMEEFYAYYQLCQTEPVHCDRIYLHHLMEGLSIEEQCHRLHDLAEGLRLLEDGGETTAYPGPFSENVRDQLLERTLSLLKKQEAAPLAAKNEKDARLPDSISGELFTALTALTLYCMAKKGQLEGCPREITLEQAVTSVCRKTAEQQTKDDLEQGYIVPEAAEECQRAANKASFLLLLVAGICGGIFASIFHRNLLLVIAAIRGAVSAGERIVPQAEEILSEITEEQILELSDMTLLHGRQIAVDESLLLSEDTKKKTAANNAYRQQNTDLYDDPELKI